MFAILVSGFAFFENILSRELVVGLDLGQIDHLDGFNDKIRFVGSCVVVPIDLALLRCWSQPLGHVLLALGVERIRGMACLLDPEKTFCGIALVGVMVSV